MKWGPGRDVALAVAAFNGAVAVRCQPSQIRVLAENIAAFNCQTSAHGLQELGCEPLTVIARKAVWLPAPGRLSPTLGARVTVEAGKRQPRRREKTPGLSEARWGNRGEPHYSRLSSTVSRE
jgi:hypothetical protein